MNNNYSHKLSKRLGQYGSLALALTGLSEAANSQVIYTDVNPDFSGSLGSTYAIDLDNDGIDDVTLVNYTSSSSINNYNLNINVLYAYPEGLNKVLGSISPNSSSLAYPFALSTGNLISANTSSWIGSSASNILFGEIEINSMPYFSAGNWDNVEDKYLGIEFDINGNTHYGWVRLNVKDAKFTLKDYAYESTPNTAITAGDQGNLSSDHYFKNNLEVFSNNNQLFIKAIDQEKLNYSLFSINGQKVLEGELLNQQNSLDISNLSSGVYLVNIVNDKNQKFVLKMPNSL